VILKLATEYLDAGKGHCGIIVSVRRRESEVAQRLLSILDRFSAEEMCDLLLYI
jgi:hypothetical protein